MARGAALGRATARLDTERERKHRVGYYLDHIVIGVNDLATASADYQQAGFEVTPGGEHSSGNTHNALVTFDDGAYLELIAFKDKQIKPEHKWGAKLARGEGFLDFALGSDDLEAEAARLDQAGIEHSGVRPLGRLRPDGQRIDWLLLNATDETHPLPFLIEDITPRELRVPGGDAAKHPLAATGIAGVRLLVRDLEAAATRFKALLGVEGSDVAPAIIGGAAAKRFALGSQWIELIQPSSDATALQDYLAERGGAPYEIVLAGGTAPNGGPLPLASTHQARMWVGQSIPAADQAD